jgi:hypothetical protein
MVHPSLLVLVSCVLWDVGYWIVSVSMLLAMINLLVSAYQLMFSEHIGLKFETFWAKHVANKFVTIRLKTCCPESETFWIDLFSICQSAEIFSACSHFQFCGINFTCLYQILWISKFMEICLCLSSRSWSGTATISNLDGIQLMCSMFCLWIS